MEKAKISAYQLFLLILLFEHGSAMLVPLAIDAKRDAWLAILIGMLGGLGLYWVYYRLYRFYPQLMPTEYIQKLLGKYIGKLVVFSYILFFMYLASRVLRDFGEMLITSAYPQTPIFVLNTLLMLVIVYALRQGIEVIARTGELLFYLMYFLAFVGFVLIVASGLIDLNLLRPVLEDGFVPVFKVVLTQTLYVPFGEAAVFMVILPYLNKPKKGLFAGMLGIALAGVNLAIVMAVNLSVLGLDLASRSQFPLLTTIQSIQLADFLERLDVFFMVAVVVSIFFKVSVFFYAAVESSALLFNIKETSQLVYPFGLVILILSMTIASSYSEHLVEGLEVTTRFLHPLFFAIIPLTLLALAYIKNRRGARS